MVKLYGDKISIIRGSDDPLSSFTKFTLVVDKRQFGLHFIAILSGMPPPLEDFEITTTGNYAGKPFTYSGTLKREHGGIYVRYRRPTTEMVPIFRLDLEREEIENLKALFLDE